MDEVKQAREMGWAATTIFDESVGKGKQVLDGQTIVMCPIDDYKKKVTCNSCRLCRVDEKDKNMLLGSNFMETVLRKTNIKWVRLRNKLKINTVIGAVFLDCPLTCNSKVPFGDSIFAWIQL